MEAVSPGKEEVLMEGNKLPFETGFVPPHEVSPRFRFGKGELLLAPVLLILGILLADMLLYTDLALGFSVICLACLGIMTGYLLRRGHKLTGYSGTLLALSGVIALSFVRSEDGFVKFVMLCFLLVSGTLGLCLLAGQNRRSPAGVTSLADCFRAFFYLGIWKMPEAFRGLNDARKDPAHGGKDRGAVLGGLLIAVPVVAILIAFLISADAAFEGLVAKLPEVDMGEPLVAAIFGAPMGVILYTASVALHHNPKEAPAPVKNGKIHPLTVNTVLICVGAVYGVYLFSQLAYFVGGFAGILPEDYTMAQYARRGFFDMAWLCAINLAIMTGAVGLVKKENGRVGKLTRALCLFVGVMTVFFVAASGAKMVLYIDGYGLTRLRVLTCVIEMFFGITAVIVSIWLFLPKLPYMKAVILAGLLLGALTAWVDVDTVVASYNVHAYQTGQLETVDVAYLGELSDSALPYIARLTQDGDEDIAAMARRELDGREAPLSEDLRSWNIAAAIAQNAWQWPDIDD